MDGRALRREAHRRLPAGLITTAGTVAAGLALWLARALAAPFPWKHDPTQNLIRQCE